MLDDEKDKIDEKEDKFFEDLLDDIDDNEDEEENNEDKGDGKKDNRSQKNRDAEEARKRREAEEKAKREEEERKKAEEEAKRKAEEEKKKAEENASKKTQKLGEQLVDFKKKYPDVDLAELDNDKSFKRYIDGKLLGKKDFTSLYEEYLEMKSELSGVSQDEVRKNYERKAKSSSGTAIPRGNDNPTEVYSEEELKRITDKLPYMSDKETNKIMEKFEKSVEFYKKNKK
jgi:hypothetical protein